jgi:hypothetical protein
MTSFIAKHDGCEPRDVLMFVAQCNNGNRGREADSIFSNQSPLPAIGAHVFFCARNQKAERWFSIPLKSFRLHSGAGSNFCNVMKKERCGFSNYLIR